MIFNLVSQITIKSSFYIVLILVICNSCFSQNRSFLTEEQKKWNPYRDGQVLIFKSNSNLVDSIHIIEGENLTFPDGPRLMYYNEILRVVASHELPGVKNPVNTHFFKIFAATNEESAYINFIIHTENFGFFGDDFTIDELDSLPTIVLNLPNQTLTDVIVIGDRTNSLDVETAIETLYWSKSKGYVKLELYDGSIWELYDIL